MKEFESTFKIVLRAFYYKKINFLELLFWLYLCFASFDVRGQLTCTTNISDSAHSADTEKVAEELEIFYGENFMSHEYWDKLQKHFKGNNNEYLAIREKLVVKMYALYSDFGDKCLQKRSITESDKRQFEIEAEKELATYMNEHSLLTPAPVPSPTPTPPLECENIDFEKCDFTGWQMFEGNVISSTSVTPPPSAFSYINITPTATSGTGFPVLNLNFGRQGVQHSIISTPGLDPNVPIQMIKPGGGCSAMIGDGFGNKWKAASIKRNITITPNNYNFYYSYAVVMQNPNHGQVDQPYFRIRLYDQNNQSVECAKYDVYAGNGDTAWLSRGSLDYVDWKSAFIPLQAYMGQTLTIEFTVGDCTQGGHSCYAYIEGECDVPIKLSDTATCKGHPVLITAPPGAKTYLWSTGATTQSISVEQQGEYWVKMEGTAGGCFSYDTVHVGTYDISTASYVMDNACVGSATKFTDKSYPAGTISQWAWSFQNNGSTNSTVQNPSYTYPSSGTHNAKLTITNIHGCVDDTIQQIFVAPAPVAAFSSNPVCANDSTVFINSSTGTITQYKWDFLNNNQFFSSLQNPKYKYSAVATAKLKVTTQFGCSDSITHPIVINPLPVANFTVPNVCFPEASVFTNTSTISSGSVAQWNWNFGDGNTNNTQNPSHNYSTYGNKTVKLVVASNLGCKDSISKTLSVFEKPTINFSTTSVCDKISSALSNSSTLASAATFASWNWDIMNDGSTDYSTKNATHLFASAGSYRILLKGTSSDGCWDTISKPVTIYPLPHADFSSKNVCKGKASSYTDKSTGTIVTWKWDFDNNNSVESSSQNPTYTFANKGSYSSKLKVVSDKGCADSIVKTAIVHPLPIAAYSANNMCIPHPVSFANSSSVTLGNITYQKWKFTSDIGDTTNNFNPTKAFDTHGTFNVKLLVRSDSGCVDSITKSVLYFEKPVVDFTLNDLCANATLNLNNTSTLSSSTFTSWKWDIDNNSSTDYTTQNTVHKYTQHGLKTIQLIGATAQGCLDTMIKTMTVHPLPIADFSPTPNCVNDSASFTESCSIPAGTITNYDWNFNEGNGALVKGPKKKFSTPGNKQVRLIITSDKNCKDTVDKPVMIYPLPQPNFTTAPVCLNSPTVFNNSSVISSQHSPNQIVQHQWKFDDGQSLSSPQAQHLFAAPGNHKVTLITTSAHNCRDSISKTIVVHPLPSPKFTSSAPEGCATWCVDFTNATKVASGSIASYTWNFGDGNSSAAPNPSNCFENVGSTPLSFDISLRATTDKGCVKDTVIQNMITANPITHADFTFTPGEITEDNNKVFFSNASSGENSWLWKYDDDSTDGIENPEHQFTKVGDHFITLVVNNQYNCADSITKKITQIPVWSYHIPNAFTPNGDGLNDKFYVYGYNITEFKLYIFNRWGELIFTSNDISEGWDGIYNGYVVQIDTYIYKAYLTDIFGDKHSEVGIVNCIK
ncbi:MAG: PKD domain-containing protein [Flavobacteriales bacterium]